MDLENHARGIPGSQETIGAHFASRLHSSFPPSYTSPPRACVLSLEVKWLKGGLHPLPVCSEGAALSVDRRPPSCAAPSKSDAFGARVLSFLCFLWSLMLCSCANR